MREEILYILHLLQVWATLVDGERCNVSPPPPGCGANSKICTENKNGRTNECICHKKTSDAYHWIIERPYAKQRTRENNMRVSSGGEYSNMFWLYVFPKEIVASGAAQEFTESRFFEGNYSRI